MGKVLFSEFAIHNNYRKHKKNSPCHFQSSASMLDSFRCCSVFRATGKQKKFVTNAHKKTWKNHSRLPSKYPVSVGFSGFGIKGGVTDSKFSQSIDSKNGIWCTSLAVGRSLGSVVKNNSTAATASSDNASSSCGHSISRNMSEN